MTMLYAPNVQNYKEHHSAERIVAVTLHDHLVSLERHHGNDTTSKSYVAVTLHDRLVRKG